MEVVRIGQPEPWDEEGRGGGQVQASRKYSFLGPEGCLAVLADADGFADDATGVVEQHH